MGEPTFEATRVRGPVFTWPDLVFSEFICMVLLTVGLVLWSILLKAPLEEPANTSVAPNPSKAPWYFLGLQEMLVYFDPWMAGVVLPGLIIVGLMAIPYIDTNPKGNGYYTLKERKTAIWLFMFGFLILWVRADRHRYLPARAELELLRAVRVLGRQQGRAAGQCRPVGADLDPDPGRRAAEQLHCSGDLRHPVHRFLFPRTAGDPD